MIIALSCIIVASCATKLNTDTDPQPCSEQWVLSVEESVPTGDSEGHGPDPGSDEWRSVVEFKLGVRGNPATPPHDTPQWCAYIDEIIYNSGSR